MATKPTLNMIVHVNDETVISSSPVPSTDAEFVSVKVGPDVSILLFNPAQARALADAAVEAFRLLKQMEVESEAESIWGNGTVTESEYDTWIESGQDGTINCSIEDPCQDCIDTMGYADEDESVLDAWVKNGREDEVINGWANCTISNPCPDCRDYPDYEEEPLYYDFEDQSDRF